MNLNSDYPYASASALTPTLHAPTLGVGGVQNNVVDDVLIDGLAAAGEQGIPFIVPYYKNVAAGDTIVFIGNGRSVGFHRVTPSEFDAKQPFTIYVPLSIFKFTGRFDLYYYQQDVNASKNHAVSLHIQLIVQRSAFPAPYASGDDSLPQPTVSPATYNKRAFDNGTPVVVTVSYPAIAVGDMLTLAIEMRADTLNTSPTFYYPDPSPVARDILPRDADAKGVQFTLPASSFKDVDESISSVFYTICSNDQPWWQKRSHRAVFQVDTVPPFA